MVFYLIFQEFYTFNNVNFLLKRTVPFDTFGRYETEEQSDQDYVSLSNFLKDKNVLFSEVNESEKTVQIINILKTLRYIK